MKFLTDFLKKTIMLGKLKSSEGQILFYDEPVLILRTSVLFKIQDDLTKKYGVRAHEFMYNIGKFNGESAFKKLVPKVKNLRKGMEKIPLVNPVFQIGSNFFSAGGWGEFEPIFLSKDLKNIKVRVKNSPIANAHLKLNGRSKKPVCSYISGMLEGALAGIFEREIKFKEIQCKSQGKDCCIFVTK